MKSRIAARGLIIMVGCAMCLPLPGAAQKPVAKAPAKSTAKPAAPDNETKFRMVLGAMSTIKKHLRDPESVVWEYAGVSEAGDAVCITYRAKNGYGGYSRSIFVVDNKGISEAAASWNRSCAGKSLTDYTYARRALP